MQPSSFSFEIESIMSDVLIGYYGANIKTIQQVSGADIRVSKRGFNGRCKVKISGTQKQQQVAVDLIGPIIGRKIRIQSESASSVPKRILKRGSGPLSLVALGPVPEQSQQPSHSTQVDMVCNPSRQILRQHPHPRRTTYPRHTRQQFPTKTSRTSDPGTSNKTNTYPPRKSRLPTIPEHLLDTVSEQATKHT